MWYVYNVWYVVLGVEGEETTYTKHWARRDIREGASLAFLLFRVASTIVPKGRNWLLIFLSHAARAARASRGCGVCVCLCVGGLIGDS